jgi:hypothetical protein
MLSGHSFVSRLTVVMRDRLRQILADLTFSNILYLVRIRNFL